MKKVLSLILAAAMLFGSALLLSSCTAKDDGPDVTVYLTGAVYDLDPSLAYTNDNAVKIMSQIYEPLFRLDSRGRVVNALASGWRVEERPEEGLYQMVITLRETYWQNGTQVLADDVAYAWRRILEPSFESQASTLLFDIKNAVKVKNGQDKCTIDDLGISADKLELTITFEKKIDYQAFLKNLTSVALVPLKENAVTKSPDTWSKKVSTIYCSGPFYIRTFDHNTGSFVLARNKYYRRAKDSTSPVQTFVTPNTITMTWNRSGSQEALLQERLNGLLNGDPLEGTKLYYLGELPLDGRADLAYKTTDLNSTFSLVLNTNEEPFDNAKVRQALSMAIDREYISSLLGYGIPATGLLPGTVKDTNGRDKFRDKSGNLIETTADLEGAKALLAEAGVDPSDYSFRISYDYNVDDQAVINYVIEQWQALGFRVTARLLMANERTEEVNGVDVTFLDSGLQVAYTNGDFDVIAIDYQAFSTNPFASLAAFSSTLNGNGLEWILDPKDHIPTGSRQKPHISGFANSDYDALIQSAYEETDLRKKAEYLHQAEAKLMEEMPVIPLLFNQSAYLTDEKLTGLSFDGYGIPDLTRLSFNGYLELQKQLEEAKETPLGDEE